MNLSKVALTKGKNRYKNVFQGLNLIRRELAQKIKGKKRAIIKVNFVSPNNQLAATHVEAIKALLDFIKPFYKEQVKVVETGPNAQAGFSNFNFRRLANDYNLKLNSFAQDREETILLYDAYLRRRIKARLCQEPLMSDFLISITPTKTHDVSVVTLSLKNVAVGFLKNPSAIHQGYQAFNKNLFLLIQRKVPDLAIIDGTVGMEGDGPLFGSPKAAGWVVSSLNSVQADVVATKLMGFDPRKVGYLYYCLQEGLATDDLGKVKILGEKVENCQVKFVPHLRFERQLKWNSPPNLKEKAKIHLVEKIYTPFKQTSLGQRMNTDLLVRLINRLFGFQ